MSSDMTNGNEDSDCGEDGEIWEEEGGYLVISTDKVILQFFFAERTIQPCLLYKYIV